MFNSEKEFDAGVAVNLTLSVLRERYKRLLTEIKQEAEKGKTSYRCNVALRKYHSTELTGGYSQADMEDLTVLMAYLGFSYKLDGLTDQGLTEAINDSEKWMSLFGQHQLLKKTLHVSWV